MTTIRDVYLEKVKFYNDCIFQVEKDIRHLQDEIKQCEEKKAHYKKEIDRAFKTMVEDEETLARTKSQG